MATQKFHENTSEYLHKIASQALVVIPVGAVEQHGPHLPVGHDSFNVQQIAEMAAEKTGNEKILVAPTIWYGSSHHHIKFTGTMSLRGQTLLSVLCDLGNSLAMGGFKKILFLNGHGGNRFMAGEAAKTLVTEYDNDLIVGAAEYWVIAGEALKKMNIRVGHAGNFETSVQMARDEKLIDYDGIEYLKNGSCPGCKDYQHRFVTQEEREALRLKSLRGKGYFQRKDQYVVTGGVSEVPENASAQLGEKLIKIVVDEVAKFFVEFWEHS